MILFTPLPFLSLLIAGFNRVFPMQKLSTFSPHELRLLLCGEQAPNWTREDVLRFTEPRFGYTKDRYMSLGLWSLAVHSSWLAGWLCLAGNGDCVSVYHAFWLQ